MPKFSANRKKVLLVLYYYHPYVSGLSVYAKQIAEGLVERGYEVTVLTSRYDKTLPEEVIGGVRIKRCPVWLTLGKGVIMPTFWLQMIQLGRHHDYINPHLPQADSGLASLFLPKKKMIVTYHCDINLGDGLVNELVERTSMALMHVQLMRAQTVVSNSEDYLAHSQMKRYLPKAQAIYPPVVADNFKPVDSAPLFKRLGIGAKTVKIGFVGRIVYEKGIRYLLEAIPHLQKELPDFKIILAGDYEKVAGGSVKDELDTYMDKYPDRIQFTGYLSDQDRNRFYSGLDVFVLPSIDPLESFGMVQVEALLCGAPVVASDLPGVRQVATESGYGRVAKRKNPKDLAKQIIEVVKNPKKYRP
jgi:glycosyltransferase involved in cell wall biosynthesis